MSTNLEPLKREVGRPPGPVTAKQLLKQELKEAIKLNKQIRELVQDQLSEVNKALRDNPTIDVRLKVITVLGKMIELQGKGLDAAAGHLVESENVEAADDDGGSGNIDGLLKSLKGGS